MDGTEAALRCSLRDCGFPEEAAAQYLAGPGRGTPGPCWGCCTASGRQPWRSSTGPSAGWTFWTT